LIYKFMYFCLPRLRFLKCSKGHKYLDLGCGDGVALRQNLSVRPDLNCFCIDVRNFSNELPDNAAFTLYNGENLPYKNNTFDLITANHVIEHIYNPNLTFSELKRILRKGGRIFIEVPNKRSLWGKPGGRFAGTVHFNDDPTHLRPYSKRDLIKLCQTSGFRIVKFGISRNLLHLFLSPVLLLFGLLMPKW